MSEFQNTEGMVVFPIVFGICRHLLIVLPIRVKHCMSNVLFFFNKAKCMPPKNWVHIRGELSNSSFSISSLFRHIFVSMASTK